MWVLSDALVKGKRGAKTCTRGFQTLCVKVHLVYDNDVKL